MKLVEKEAECLVKEGEAAQGGPVDTLGLQKDHRDRESLTLKKPVKKRQLYVAIILPLGGSLCSQHTWGA